MATLPNYALERSVTVPGERSARPGNADVRSSRRRIHDAMVQFGLALRLGNIHRMGGTLRMGTTKVPLANATSEATILAAVQGALEPSEKSCTPTVLERGKPPSDGSNGTTEKLALDVCGKRQRYELTWIQISIDQVMVTAKRI